jgi:hypothetical protein
MEDAPTHQDWQAVNNHIVFASTGAYSGEVVLCDESLDISPGDEIFVSERALHHPSGRGFTALPVELGGGQKLFCVDYADVAAVRRKVCESRSITKK